LVKLKHQYAEIMREESVSVDFLLKLNIYPNAYASACLGVRQSKSFVEEQLGDSAVISFFSRLVCGGYLLLLLMIIHQLWVS
jgi:hypothetical protein